MLSTKASTGLNVRRWTASAAYQLPCKHAQLCRPLRFKEEDKQEAARKEFEKQLGKSDKPLIDQTTDALKDAKNEVQTTLQQAASKPEVDAQVKVSLLQPAFTRRREIFVGRIAMVGFFAACFWEWFFPTHPNITQQVSGFLDMAGISLQQEVVTTGIIALIAYNVIASFGPWSPTFDLTNLRDVAKRPIGPPSTWVNPITDYKRFFGVTNWGFTKANELFHGRLAMLGFAGVIWRQFSLGGFAGPGPLAQLAMTMGLSSDPAFYNNIPSFFIGFTIFATALAYLNGNTGSIQGEEEIY